MDLNGLVEGGPRTDLGGQVAPVVFKDRMKVVWSRRQVEKWTVLREGESKIRFCDCVNM